MDMDQDLNAAEAATEVSLRDELASRFEKMSVEPASEPTPEAVEPPAQEETAEQTAQRLRDEQGRFAKADEQGAPDKSQEPKEEEPQAAEGKRYAGPPPGWSVGAKAEFDTLPESVKQAISKREEEVDNGFAKLREYKELEKNLEPYQSTAKEYGVDLPELLKRFDAADKYLRSDPTNAIKWLAQSYGVDLRQVAGQPAGQGGQQQQNGKIDPALQPIIEPLMREIQSLKQQLGRVDTIEQSLHAEKFNQVSGTVEQFFADPKNKYAENVADQMVLLISQAKASGKPVDLDQIYETACYMDPEVRGALIKEQSTRQQATQAEKARQAATQARQAGASVTGGPSATQPTTEPDSENLRSLLERNFAEQMGRT